MAEVTVVLPHPWMGVHDVGFANYRRELPFTKRIALAPLGIHTPRTVTIRPSTSDGTLLVADLAFEP